MCTRFFCFFFLCLEFRFKSFEKKDMFTLETRSVERDLEEEFCGRELYGLLSLQARRILFFFFFTFSFVSISFYSIVCRRPRHYIEVPGPQRSPRLPFAITLSAHGHVTLLCSRVQPSLPARVQTCEQAPTRPITGCIVSWTNVQTKNGNE